MENRGCLLDWLGMYLYDTWGTRPTQTGSLREKP
jgi:hypothetical protein